MDPFLLLDGRSGDAPADAGRARPTVPPSPPSSDKLPRIPLATYRTAGFRRTQSLASSLSLDAWVLRCHLL